MEGSWEDATGFVCRHNRESQRAWHTSETEGAQRMTQEGKVHRVRVSPYLPVLHQVCPHAGAVPAPHQDMVGEEIDAGQRAGELAT